MAPAHSTSNSWLPRLTSAARPFLLPHHVQKLLQDPRPMQLTKLIAWLSHHLALQQLVMQYRKVVEAPLLLPLHRHALIEPHHPDGMPQTLIASGRQPPQTCSTKRQSTHGPLLAMSLLPLSPYARLFTHQKTIKLSFTRAVTKHTLPQVNTYSSTNTNIMPALRP